MASPSGSASRDRVSKCARVVREETIANGAIAAGSGGWVSPASDGQPEADIPQRRHLEK